MYLQSIVSQTEHELNLHETTARFHPALLPLPAGSESSRETCCRTVRFPSSEHVIGQQGLICS